ncbi:transcription termination factor 4, mitochondrial isoform X1 [Balaenoptera acutorostrata]|uniref:Transcription termination factor 4, mitochondrial isoform X1 n=1 Tax=Balaenoptera acutorostrata TaxID=9767 RepID=A0A384AC25_BALAC|nr:transcription termination factor 4, mitochondrial isoform X1 [Balaenoptera acutorostrata]
MAALGWQVSAWHRLIPLTWSLIARQTAQLGEQKRTTALLLRKLTTVSSGGDLGESPFVEPQKCAQEPEHRTGLTQCLLEKQRTAVERGKIVSSLLDMGFSDVHVNELLSIQPGTHPQQLLDIISELILLGLNPEPVCVAFKRSPQLLKLPIMQMKKRSSYLRKLGLGEGKLKRVLYCCPEVFTMRQRDIEIIVGVLKEKCLFTVKQVTEILHRCPCVLREDPGELEYKFQHSVKHATRGKTGERTRPRPPACRQRALQPLTYRKPDVRPAVGWVPARNVPPCARCPSGPEASQVGLGWSPGEAPRPRAAGRGPAGRAGSLPLPWGCVWPAEGKAPRPFSQEGPALPPLGQEKAQRWPGGISDLDKTGRERKCPGESLGGHLQPKACDMCLAGP